MELMEEEAAKPRPEPEPCATAARVRRRYALAVFYYATLPPPELSTDDFLGEQEESAPSTPVFGDWTNQYLFLSKFHECSWFEPFLREGVNPENVTDMSELFMYEGVKCLDEEGDELVTEKGGKTVHTLELRFTIPNEMFGSIPSEITSLLELRILSIENQNLGNRLPSTIGDLSNLVSLSLYNNEFVGTIPQAIQTLSSLLFLNLGKNLFEGNLESDELSWEGLTLLEELVLSQNQFSGELPSTLGMLPLKTLDLSSNRFIGTIPLEWSAMSDTMRTLILDTNQLDGDLQVLGTESGNTSRLSTLLLHNNQFTGSIPESLFLGFDDLAPIIVDLGNNTFTGSIPDSFTLLSTRLEYFVLTQNEDIVGDVDVLCLEPNEQESSFNRTILVDCRLNCNCCTACCDNVNGTSSTVCDAHLTLNDEYNIRFALDVFRGSLGF